MTNNLVTLTGNLGQTPETFTADKGEFTRLSLATTDRYKDEASDTWKDKAAVWHTVIAFSSSVQGYARSFRKGDRVKITGSLSYRKTELVIDGQKRFFTEASVIASRIEDARLPKMGA